MPSRFIADVKLNVPIRFLGEIIIFKSFGDREIITKDHPPSCGYYLLGCEGEMGIWINYIDRNEQEFA